MGFDPIQYKTTTRQQWEDAADAWHRWGPTLEADGEHLESLRAGSFDAVISRVGLISFPSAARCVQFERESFGALHQMLSGLSEAERSTVWEEIAKALERVETADGFVGPCEMLVASGTK